jgi:isoquinoline 1-oxidoreductase alpha subunit
MTVELNVNGRHHRLDVDPETPLLWVLRDRLGLTGTKFGCGVGECGACTVHLEGAPVFSCQVPVARAAGKAVTTIEGLSDDHPVKRAWVAEQVVQCGYCQPGQIMRASALLARTPAPDEAEIDRIMRPNLCRCGTYPRIKRAIRTAAKG